MLFKNVVGHSGIKQKLIQSVMAERVSHSQLFLGSLGHGGLPLALAFAQYLNCEAPTEDDSCGTCPSCLKADKLVHPDIHYSYPFARIDKKVLATEFVTEWRLALLENPYLSLYDWMSSLDAENKQSNITVPECHNIIKKLSLKAFEGKYKVQIIWLPEYLGEAGNILLKILEEPPENTVFLLIAENEDKILNTILSRSQALKIPPIAYDDLVAVLVEKHGIETEAAQKIAAISRGNYRSALSALNQSVNDNIKLFQNWIILSASYPIKGHHAKLTELLDLIDGFSRLGRENQKGFFDYGLHFIRESLHTMVTGNISPILTEPELAFVDRLNKKMDTIKYQELYNMLNEVHYHFERNAHPKIAMLNLSIKLSKLLNKKVAVTENYY